MLNFRSINNSISLNIEKEKGKIVLTVYQNGKDIAIFDILDVWDMLKAELSNIPEDEYDNPGLKRRIYEASNIPRLTYEFVKEI